VWDLIISSNREICVWKTWITTTIDVIFTTIGNLEHCRRTSNKYL